MILINIGSEYLPVDNYDGIIWDYINQNYENISDLRQLSEDDILNLCDGLKCSVDEIFEDKLDEGFHISDEDAEDFASGAMDYIYYLLSMSK